MANYVQQINKLVNDSIVLGLNGATITSLSTADGIKVGRLQVSTVSASSDVTTKDYVDNLIAATVQSGSLTIAASDDDVVNLEASWDSTSSTITLAASHASYAELTPTDGSTITSGATVITALTRDTYGHITGYTASPIVFSDYQGWNAIGEDGSVSVNIGSDETFAIVGDDTYITTLSQAAVDGTNAGIKIKHVTKTVTENAATEETVTAGSATVIPVKSYTFDDAGHASAVDTVNYTIDIPAVTITNGSETTATYVTSLTADEHAITVGKTSAVTDLSSISAADYSKLATSEAIINYVSSKLATTDAMTYIGTAASESALTETTTGSTYKASAAFTLSAASSSTGAAVSVKTGDLLVLNSSGTWDVIPSGDDGDVTANGTLTSGYIIVGGSDKTIQASSIALDDCVFTDHITTLVTGSEGIITVTSTTSDDSTEYTVSHAASGVTAGSYGSSDTVSGVLAFNIPYLTVSALGHITSASSISVDLESAVLAKISANALSSTDFSISGTTLSLITGETANALSKSTDSTELNWGGSKITIGTGTSKVEVATKISTTYAGDILIADTDGGLASSGAEILKSSATWTASDYLVPTAAAITNYVDTALASGVPSGTTQTIALSATTSTVSTTSELPLSTLIKRIILVVSTAYTSTGGSTISIGGTTKATEGTDYTLTETGIYEIDCWSVLNTAGAVTFTPNGASGGACTIYVDYVTTLVG